MNIRQQISDGLAPYLPAGWDLIDYATEPDVLARPLVMIDVRNIEPGPSQGIVQIGAHIFVLLPTRDSAKRNDDAVEDSMPFVVDILNRMQAVTTVTATRGDFLERLPCWDIELTLYSTITTDSEEE